MAFDAIKQVMLEKQYLYVRASKGFALEGVSTEQIWSNVGYYRFLVDNVQKALGNSYVRIHHMASDTEFMAECSDLFLEEIQNSVVVAVETLTGVLEDFAEQNHHDISQFSNNVGSGMGLLQQSLVGSKVPGSSFNLLSGLNSLTVANHSDLSSLYDILIGFRADNHFDISSLVKPSNLVTIESSVVSLLQELQKARKFSPTDFSAYDSLYNPTLVQSGDFYKCDCTSLLQSLSVGESKSFLIERSALSLSDNTHVKMLFSYGVPVGSFSIMTSEDVNKVFKFNTSFRDNVIFFDHPVSDFGSAPQTLFIKIVLTKLS